VDFKFFNESFKYKRICGDGLMGGGPKEDPSVKAKQEQELARQEREAERLRKDRIAASDATRRGQRGRQSLLGTEGGELGSKSLLGGK
jgi:hypothetical protein